MNRLICLLCAFLLGASVLAVNAQAQENPASTPKDLAALDTALAKALQDAKVPGATVAIIENGDVVLTKAYGLVDVAANKAATPASVFRAGSISKGLVGISVMMLVEEGKLDLNAKLSDLAPELAFDNPWEATDPVRLVHLMEHTSGFDDIGFHHYLIDGTNMPLRQAIEQYGPYRSRWKPGSFVAYCNSGPVIAGYIVEKASGMSWADFTRTRIFEPLGMTSAYWDQNPAIADRIAKSYKGDGTTEEPYVDIPGKPAGALNIEARDLAKLAQMLIGRGSLNGITVLTPESVDRLERPGSTLAVRSGLQPGYGLGNMALAGEKAVFHGHDGGIDGFLSTYAYEPKHRAGYVIMINAPQGDALRAAETVTAYLQRDWPSPTAEFATPASAELEALTGIYQSVAPRQQMFAPLESLASWTPVKLVDGALNINGTARRAVTPRIFQRIDRVAPNVVFVDSPEGMLLLTATGAERRMPTYQIVVKAAWVACFLITLLICIVHGIVWLTGWARGKLNDRGGVTVRALPALAVFSIAGVAVLLMVGLAGANTLDLLGKPSLLAWSICLTTLVIPLFGFGALMVALSASAQTPRAVRALAWAASALALTASAFLWHYGWIGLKTWS